MMYEIWDGDVLIYSTGEEDIAEEYWEDGYAVYDTDLGRWW